MSKPLVLRGQAAYLITFHDIAPNSLPMLARQIAEVFDVFPHVQEVRVSAATGHLAAYVSVPEDVTIEAIDAKADELRAKWDLEREAGH